MLVSRKLADVTLISSQKLHTSLAMSKMSNKGKPARTTFVVLARAKIATESISILKIVYGFSVVRPNMSTTGGESVALCATSQRNSRQCY